MAMGNKTKTGEGGPRPVLELVPSGLKPPSAQKRRLFELRAPDADEAILYQYSVLYQTCVPFRDPGDEVRQWERANGVVTLTRGDSSMWGCRSDRHRAGADGGVLGRLPIPCTSGAPVAMSCFGQERSLNLT